jgi:hypothetical protein
LYAHWSQAYTGTYIYDEASLRAIGSSGTYHIVKDITLTGDWTPKDSFSGVLDGHGHTIKDVKYATRTSGTNNVVRYGFFRSLSGTIQNVTFTNLNMEIVKSKDGQTDVYVGGIAGVFDGTLDNVHLVDSNVYNEHHRDVVTSGDYVNTHTGGLVGAMMAGTIRNCSMTGTGSVYSISKFATKSADAQAFAGGIVGTMAAGNITGCTRGDGIKVTAHSEVDSSKSAYRSAAGGIIGNRGGGSYSNLTSTANNLFATYDRGSYANSSWARKGQYIGNGG